MIFRLDRGGQAKKPYSSFDPIENRHLVNNLLQKSPPSKGGIGH